MSKHEKMVWRKIEPYYTRIGILTDVSDYDNRERGDTLPVYYVQKKAEVGEEVMKCEKYGRLVHDFSDFNFCPYCGESIGRAMMKSCRTCKNEACYIVYGVPQEQKKDCGEHHEIWDICNKFDCKNHNKYKGVGNVGIQPEKAMV